MTQEMIEAKVATMESDIKEIKQDVKDMPDQIANKLEGSIDIKIKLAISEAEKKYQGKFIGLLVTMLLEAIGLIITFLR